MSWCDRRLLLGALAALPACGFAPAYGPSGSAGRLQGRVALSGPEGEPGYLLNRRIDERLGHASAGTYLLETAVATDEADLGTTSTGTTTRYRIIGSVDFRLTEAATGAVLLSDTVDSFTGYSATGSSVATLAARRDALERLMTILADRIVDRLILAADELPA